jgi:xylan 1,4-beta-xylosidase
MKILLNIDGMKSLFVSAKWIIILIISISCSQGLKDSPQVATYQNPIFAGDYPDPSILRDGDDYYIVHSSFEYYPGLLIWHSKNLINWEPVTHALQQYVGSVWAPELVKYEGKYFIYFPANDKNYVIAANTIEGPWSDPVELDIAMIDPGHVVDSVGNRYLFFSSGSYIQLSKDGLSLVGQPHHVYDGWKIPRDWSIECFCMEGPKLFKRGEYFYLTVAEGGTAGPATGHMVISARSKSLFGPWENSPNNPILRAQSNEENWWSIGHGTVFDDVDGNWWMIFHGYEKEHYNMGRQTMLTPLEWTQDGWFSIPKGVNIAQPIAIPGNRIIEKSPTNFSDSFAQAPLNPRWTFFGGLDENRLQFEDNSLVITGKGNGVANSSPMLYIPSDHSYSVQVEIEIEGDAIGGLVLFYNQSASSGILADQENILANLRGWQFPTEKKVIERHAYLRLDNINHTVNMFYSKNGTDWIKIENSFEASAYHHNILSGFMSLRIGLTAFGSGKVRFKNFKYEEILD